MAFIKPHLTWDASVAAVAHEARKNAGLALAGRAALQLDWGGDLGQVLAE